MRPGALDTQQLLCIALVPVLAAVARGETRVWRRRVEGRCQRCSPRTGAAGLLDSCAGWPQKQPAKRDAAAKSSLSERDGLCVSRAVRIGCHDCECAASIALVGRTCAVDHLPRMFSALMAP